MTHFSLIDRLIDSTPDVDATTDPDALRMEARVDRWAVYIASIRRDMEMLLASHPQYVFPNPSDLLQQSVMAYGVPRSKNTTEDDIIALITRFEPRLENTMPLALDERDEDGICSIAAEVEWDGVVKRIIVNVSAADDGYAVEIYE